MSRWRAKIFWGWRSFRTRVEDRVWAATEPARRRLHVGYHRWLLARSERGDRMWDRKEALATRLSGSRIRRRVTAFAALALAAAGITGAVVVSGGDPDEGGAPQAAPGIASAEEDGDEDRGQVLAANDRSDRPERRQARAQRAAPGGGGGAGGGPGGGSGSDAGSGDAVLAGDGPSGGAPDAGTRQRSVAAPAPRSSPKRSPGGRGGGGGDGGGGDGGGGPVPDGGTDRPTVAPPPPPPPAPVAPAPPPEETDDGRGGGGPPWQDGEHPGRGNGNSGGGGGDDGDDDGGD